jgi:1-acyl-sn-glycerol-3-phosphate acyltransferase
MIHVGFSIAFWTWFAISCATLFAVALTIFLVTLPFDRNGRALHLFSCFWAAHYLYLNPLWRLRVEGARAVDRRRAFVMVSNHQSFADILVLYATYLPFKWVSKASVFKVPFLGWNMRLNRYVPLVRGERASIERMASDCLAWLRRGVSVLIFPEGTRSPDGEVKAFKLGAFRIAREAGVPVLPIVLDGTADALPKHGAVMRAHADCRVRVLAPVDVSGFSTVEEAAEAVREGMVGELEALRASAGVARGARRAP